MKVQLIGTLKIPFKHYYDMNISPYIYQKKDGEFVTSFFAEDEVALHFPRNISKFTKVIGKKWEEIEVEDLRASAPLDTFELNLEFSLRDYQVGGVKNILEALNNDSIFNSLIFQAGTGYGKSYCLPKIVEGLMQRTLILVDRNLLVKQMFDEFTNNTKADVRVLSRDAMELGDVNIATFQMFLRNPQLAKNIANDIGFVVVDEVHVAPATEFLKVISKFPAKYRLGISATPTRSDGLTEVITDAFGFTKVIGDNPNSLGVNLIAVRTGVPVNFSDKSNFAKNFISSATSPEILKLVVDSAIAFRKKGRKVMIYATYGELHNTYKVLLEAKGYKVGIISSKVSHKKRDEIIEAFSKGEVDFLIAGVIMSKGISVHSLDTIISVATHNKESLPQTVGRLRRDHKDKKTPLWVDFGWYGKLRRNTDERFSRLSEMSKGNDKFFMYNSEDYFKLLESNND